MVGSRVGDSVVIGDKVDVNNTLRSIACEIGVQ